jgi:hypothetical protein
MKRLHQLLAALMAIAMVATMTVVPAFAAEDENTGDDSQGQVQGGTGGGQEGSDGQEGDDESDSEADTTYTFTMGYYEAADITYLPVTSVYGISGAGLRPAGKFTYTLTPAEVTDGTVDDAKNPIYKGLDLTADAAAASVTVDFESLGSKEATESETKIGKIDLTGLQATKDITGIYRYNLTQTTVYKNTLGTANKYADDKNSETYAAYIVDLVVTKGKVTAVKVWTGNGQTKTTPTFENVVVNSDDLVITHFIDNVYEKDGYTFTFQLNIPEGGVEGGITLNAGTLIYGTITNVYDSTKSEDVVFAVPSGNNTSYTDENGNTYTNIVELENGDKLDIPGLPVGMKYTVSMTDANKDNYTSRYQDYATYTSLNNDNHVAWADNTKLDTTVEKYETEDLKGTVDGYKYTNSLDHVHHVEFVSQKGISNTGVAMDTIPYAVMFVAAAAIAVLAVAKKKTNR